MYSFKLLITICLIRKSLAGGPSYNSTPSDNNVNCVACEDVLEKAVSPSESGCIVVSPQRKVHITINFKEAGKQPQTGDCYLPNIDPLIDPVSTLIKSFTSDQYLDIKVDGRTSAVKSHDF